MPDAERREGRRAGADSLLCLAAIVCAVAAMALAGAAQARELGVRDEGYLRFVSSSGSELTDSGRLRGTLPGIARVRFVYEGDPTVEASFTIVGRGWSLHGQATCELSNPTSSAPSFRGSLTLGGGRGGYAHARGSGELFGVFYRHSYALQIQAIGKLRR